jgi:hypothetical protein
MTKLVLAVLVALLAGVALAQVDLHDLPQFPSLVEVSAEAEAAAEGPDNNILTGAPLKVPVIDDPFQEDPGVDPAKELETLERVFTFEPPSAASPKAVSPDAVDILEVLDRAAIEAKKQAARRAARKAAREAKAAGVGGHADNKANNKHQMKVMSKQISKLNVLIAKATKVQSELPKKKAKLESLQKKLRRAAAKGKKGKGQGKKKGADKQGAALAAKLKLLKSKLAGLESAKSLLHKSIHGLKKVVTKRAEKAKKRKAAGKK